jgi:tetratricopeptide (TPR) repeat protein
MAKAVIKTLYFLSFFFLVGLLLTGACITFLVITSVLSNFDIVSTNFYNEYADTFVGAVLPFCIIYSIRVFYGRWKETKESKEHNERSYREELKKRIADHTAYIEHYDNGNRPNKQTYYLRGGLKNQLKDYYGAIEDYTSAIKIDPNFADAYLKRGILLQLIKDFKEAMKDYSQAIEITPDNPKGYYFRGQIRQVLKDFKGAIVDYTQVITIDRNFPDSYRNRAISKFHNSKYLDALKDLYIWLICNSRYKAEKLELEERENNIFYRINDRRSLLYK